MSTDRRQFLIGGVGLAAGLGVLGSEVMSTPAASSTVSPFRHGVASGDPLPDAVVLWTRVTPTEQSLPGSGRGPRATVRWEVALDAAFTKVVRSGAVATDAGRDHTVKLDAMGLAPATDHWFRFTYADAVSPTGRTRTAPAPGSSPERLRFGVVSCANWQAGWFSSYRHLAERGDLDAVIHLGDYLYEYEPGKYSYGHRNEDVRRHDPPRETVSLSDYRRRHAQYKTDRDLQALHAAVPFIVTWDDHEVADGSWAHGAFEHQAREGSYATRARAARRAYDEWMPVRISGTAVAGDGQKIYRRLQFGTLVDLSMLDLRSYRSKRVDEDDPEIDDSRRTITGEHQLAWVSANLATSPCRWKLVGNPVMIAPVRLPPRPAAEEFALSQTVSLTPLRSSTPNTDEWDGYPSDRRRLLGRVESAGTTDVVFLTGDVHTAWANEVPGPGGSVVATEFVCSSITSNNVDDFIGAPPRTVSLTLEAAIQTENPHVRFVNLDDHGHCVLEVTPERVQMDWYAVADRRDPRSGSRRLASWAVRSGNARIEPVDRTSRA
ncbi:alkaline phosphatase [Aeromicrobium sp. Root236]|uniref:alkaline phosphatase D family protein n=1 Tax=Aeromicrobium sp. Root236 TaxID=1736498 RepID=UPI0007003E3C|nr:alkaline phosphatase D family protein [Aeromicrobium sp. Root236]KRC66650.1 alkaline phosphatase [Aeromicrobium sp. Root236]